MIIATIGKLESSMKYVISLIFIIFIIAASFFLSYKFLINSQNNIQPSSPSSDRLNITLYSPDNNAVFDTKIIKIAGKTQTNAIVAAISEADEQIAIADDNGNFSFDLALSAGFNQIEIVAANNKNQANQVSLQTYYQLD